MANKVKQQGEFR